MAVVVTTVVLVRSLRAAASIAGRLASAGSTPGYAQVRPQLVRSHRVQTRTASYRRKALAEKPTKKSAVKAPLSQRGEGLGERVVPHAVVKQ